MSHRIRSALLTGLASTILQGCATATPPPKATETVVAQRVEKTPSADLLICAERPVGVPVKDTPNPGAGVLDGLERVFPAFGRNADRQDRLINFFAPGTCPQADSPAQ